MIYNNGLSCKECNEQNMYVHVHNACTVEEYFIFYINNITCITVIKIRQNYTFIMKKIKMFAILGLSEKFLCRHGYMSTDRDDAA